MLREMPSKKRQVQAAEQHVAEKPSALERAIEYAGRRSQWLCVALIALACVRIASTYTVFTATVDEPTHIASGLEWLQYGVYPVGHEHPPLSRIMAGLGPYLLGIRLRETVVGDRERLRILYSEGQYDRNLAAARCGNLVFFVIAAVVVYLWARWYFGAAVAVGAVFLFTFTPSVLAHGAVATTDMALTAFLGAAFYSLLRWMETPTWRWTVALGVTAGLATLSKFSFPVFFPAGAGIALVWYLIEVRPGFSRMWSVVRKGAVPLLVAVAIACLTIWAGYRFSYGKVVFADLRLPAPELFGEIHQLITHNAKGHPAYLLGQWSMSGFWYYYPVVLAVKTPLALLLLLVWSLAAFYGKRSERKAAWLAPSAFLVGILLVGVFSRINIGVRHILPVYMAFSVLAAAGLMGLLETATGWRRFAAGALAIWLAASSALSHPDYLPYFNELAGSEPEKILADSDLDWGQDMKRLATRLRELGVEEFAVYPFARVDPRELGFPRAVLCRPDDPYTGWNAVSITAWKVLRLGLQDKRMDEQIWPDRPDVKPRERVGKSILLYYFPPAPQ